jgi:DNA repair exonuclease SbcCD ATPase subunit
VVCAISPSSGNIDETISTLKFATRAKKIRASAKINEFFDERTLLKQYREEIRKLKRELIVAKEQNKAIMATTNKPEASPEAQENSIQETNAMKAQIEQLTRLILTSTTNPGEGKDAKQNNGTLTRAQSKSIAQNMPYLPSPGQRVRKQPSASDLNSGTEEGKDVPKVGTTASDANKAAQLAASLATTAPSEIQTQVAELVKQINNLQTRLDKQDKETLGLKTENEKLKSEIERQNQTLDEWDRYYVSIKNKHEAIQSRMKELTPESGPDLDAPPQSGQSQLGNGEFKEAVLDENEMGMLPDGPEDGGYEYGFEDDDGMLTMEGEDFNAPLVSFEASTATATTSTPVSSTTAAPAKKA